LSSELIHLKSKLLINRQDEDQENNEDFQITSEEDLRNKLLEYEKYKQITKEFHELEEKRLEVYTKLPESLKQYMQETSLKKGEFDTKDLFNAYKLFIERQKLAKPLNTKITKKELSVEDKIKDIRNILITRKKVNFIELFTEVSKEYIMTLREKIALIHKLEGLQCLEYSKTLSYNRYKYCTSFSRKK